MQPQQQTEWFSPRWLRSFWSYGRWDCRTPVDLYICVTAIATYSISNRYTLSAIFGIDINAPARRCQRGRQITGMIIACLVSKDLSGA